MTILQLFLSILVGVLTSFIILLFRKFYYKLFIPWYENRLYKGVILEGVWKGKREVKVKEKDGTEKLIHEVDMYWELKQSGYKIYGLFQAKSVDYSNREKTRKYENFYNITGHILDNYVIIEYRPVSRKRTGLGTFVLEVKGGGKKMNGSASFVEETSMTVTVFQHITLNRELD